jgi:signal transduction histidine kinase
MLLRDETSPLSERQRKMVEEAETSHQRLVALIGELSEISKLDAEAAAIHWDSCDLFALVQAATADAHSLGVDGVRVEVRGRSAQAFFGDRARLRAAFAACLQAVVREQTAACTVVVDCQRRDIGPNSSAVIVIAREPDVEWASRAVPRPFDQHRGGLGLALPIATRVIERHGGRIWSPAAAEGSTTGSGRSALVISLPVERTG